MTVDSQAEHTARADGPSIHVIRARKLLRGGAVGGLTATALCLVGFALGYGWSGLLSAGLAAAMVLFSDAGARTLLTVSMCSYTTRVVVLGLVLVLYNRYHQTWPTLVPMVIFMTTIAVVAGWLIVEVFVFSRLRIGVYDTEYVPPAGGSSAP